MYFFNFFVYFLLFLFRLLSLHISLEWNSRHLKIDSSLFLTSFLSLLQPSEVTRSPFHPSFQTLDPRRASCQEQSSRVASRLPTVPLQGHSLRCYKYNSAPAVLLRIGRDALRDRNLPADRSLTAALPVKVPIKHSVRYAVRDWGRRVLLVR